MLTRRQYTDDVWVIRAARDSSVYMCVYKTRTMLAVAIHRVVIINNNNFMWVIGASVCDGHCLRASRTERKRERHTEMYVRSGDPPAYTPHMPTRVATVFYVPIKYTLVNVYIILERACRRHFSEAGRVLGYTATTTGHVQEIH